MITKWAAVSLVAPHNIGDKTGKIDHEIMTACSRMLLPTTNSKALAVEASKYIKGNVFGS